jgi:hypothetical protein
MKKQKKNTASTAFPNDDPPVTIEQNETREIMKHEKILIKNRKKKTKNIM